ncbi:MAG: alkaline phosphatase family protein, partial [Comamonadaceae bacterium]
MKPLKKLTSICLLLAMLFTGSAGNAAPSAPERPKLVVLIVIDGLPQRQLEANRTLYVKDGFARFLEGGSWFTNAHYDHAYTVTAAGHAVLLSGASPSRSGIIGNEWRDPDTGEPMYCAQDRSATYIGQRNRPYDGTSPKNLKVETVGDVLRRVDPRSKVISISGKDRG